MACPATPAAPRYATHATVISRPTTDPSTGSAIPASGRNHSKLRPTASRIAPAHVFSPRVLVARVKAVLDGPGGGKALVLDRTPFYAEMGGQVGDVGALSLDGHRLAVDDTQAGPNGEFLHLVHRPPPDLHDWEGREVEPRVDLDRRLAIQRHHSATHILNWALRELLGDHVRQAGSLVAPDHLRFDFTHYEAVGEERIDEMIERKKDVADRVVGSGESWLTDLSNDRLRQVFRLGSEAVAE